MRNLALTAVLLAGLTGLTFAQDPPPEPPPAEEPAEKKKGLREVVAAEAQPTKRMFFVADVSGSMKQTMPQLLGAVGSIMNQPIDEFDVAMVVFNDGTARWPGFVEEDDPRPPPDKWAKFPSLNALNSASQWLLGYPGAGGTNPCGALTEALHEPRNELTVILVTDGAFNDDEAALTAIREGQAWRAENDLTPALILVFGIGKGSVDEEVLRTIAREGGGGFWVDEAQTTEERRPCSQAQPAPGPGQPGFIGPVPLPIPLPIPSPY